ncbi:RIPOR family member 3 [Bagarius yarrelli]|uniref:RIPOR family member 3 n=1 Tax=Bagarius yarrelli TaxID=175774 RepID=A0A556V862_BAGYA|nr:RIPOR family member 3 [Bagarius yarrelli]
MTKQECTVLWTKHMKGQEYPVRRVDIRNGRHGVEIKALERYIRRLEFQISKVLIRLGRQRWRIKGQIQSDDQQLWEEEQMVFLPHIHESFEIKVTEVRSLGSILVGMVTCKCADFYSAHPQMMIVDVTELGTIKLQLEVVWNPFDSGITKNHLSSASRLSASSRKRPENKSGELTSEAKTDSPHSVNSKRDPISLFSCYSTPDILQQNCVLELEPVKSKMATKNVLVEKIEEKNQKVLLINSQRRAVAIRVGQMQAQVTTTLQEMSFIKELKNLNLQIQHLNQVLKWDINILKASSCEALAVEEEEVLGSFDFLSLDFNAEDTHLCSNRVMETRFKVNTGIGKEVTLEDTVLLSEKQHKEHTAQKTVSEDRCPLSTGEYTLDQALEIHLNICIVLLRALRVSNLKYMRQYILEEISQQTGVLERIATFAHKKTHYILETIFSQFLQQIQSSSMIVPLAACTTDLVTLFQLHVYLNRWKITNFGEHISQMSTEGKKGHKVFQRMDQICTELQKEIYKNLKTEITIF